MLVTTMVYRDEVPLVSYSASRFATPPVMLPVLKTRSYTPVDVTAGTVYGIRTVVWMTLCFPKVPSTTTVTVMFSMALNIMYMTAKKAAPTKVPTKWLTSF